MTKTKTIQILYREGQSLAQIFEWTENDYVSDERLMTYFRQMHPDATILSLKYIYEARPTVTATQYWA